MLDDIALVKELHALTPHPDSPDVLADRVRYDAAAAAFAGYTHSSIVSATLVGVSCELHSPVQDPPQGTIIYLHGGGYVLGSSRSHRHVASEICRLTRCLVVVPDYSRAPEHQFPIAADEVVSVLGEASCRWPDLPLVLMGDSAGAGLAIAAAIRARCEPNLQACAIVAISPWVDLTCSGPRYAAGASHDRSLNPQRLKAFAGFYCGNTHPTHPLISPLFSSLHQLPPMLIQVGRDEILYDEALAFAHKLEAHDGQVSLEVWDDVVHAWHWYWPVLAAARNALERVALFLSRRLGEQAATHAIPSLTDPDHRPFPRVEP
ncbi:alpha/beta hydrolase fold domain-containing protein [Bradyrhizobium sp. SZCCHNR3117]